MRKSKSLNFLCLLPLLFYLTSCTNDKNISKLPADYNLQSTELFQAFSKDESIANQKYSGKLLEVVGTLARLETKSNGGVSLILATNTDGVVQCNFTKDDRPKFSNVEVGESVKIKGICSGFLLDVMLDQCVLINI